MKRFQIHLPPNLKAQLNSIVLIIDTVLLISGIVLILLIKKIIDDLYFIYDIDPWDTALDLYRLACLLIIFALSNNSVTRLIGKSGFRIIFYLLINNFYDRYHGITDWSTNDTLTIIAVCIESIYELYKKYKKIL